jgi:fatty acid-binding protein DegV
MTLSYQHHHIKWAEVLNEIYIFDTHLCTYGSGALVSYNKELLEKLNMNHDDMRKAVVFLEKHGFIIVENNNWHTITIKGVEFVLQNERIKSDKNVQYAFLVFAATMVVFEIVPYIIPAINFIIR